jgi:hypothetical protein
MFCSVLFLWISSATPQAQTAESPYGKPDDLPSGVPHVVDTNGNVFSIEPMFTTEAFQQAGLQLVIAEANAVAEELHLPELLPITQSNLTHSFIAPFGYTYIRKRLGNVTTSNYFYNIGTGFKFSGLTVANFDDRCRAYSEKYQWPVQRLDTNAPLLLATQWLASVQADVAGLARECDVHVGVNPYWNNVELGQTPKRVFTPLYTVWWTPRSPDNRTKTGTAEVELFLPTRSLLALSVDNPRYMLRPAIAFTNLAALFPGKAEITTNKPGPVIYITPPGSR